MSEQSADYVAIGQDKRADGVTEDDLVAAASKPVPAADYERDLVALAEATMNLCYHDNTENRQRAYELASKAISDWRQRVHGAGWEKNL